MIEFAAKLEYRGAFSRTSKKGNIYDVVAFENEFHERLECMTKKPELFKDCVSGDVKKFSFCYNPRFGSLTAEGVVDD